MLATEDLFLQRKAKANELIERCDKLKHLRGHSKLQRKILAENEFLSTLERKETTDDALENHLKSSNLAHLEAILSTAEAATNVASVLKKFTYSLNEYTNRELVVDVETQNGKVWLKVFARNPFAIHRIWEGLGQYGDKDVCKIASEYQLASKQNTVDFIEPKIVFLFAGGVTKSVAEGLEEMGVSAIGNLTNDPDPCDVLKPNTNTEYVDIQLMIQSLITSYETKQNEESIIKKVNLDITTLIALVSSLTNGNCHFEFEDDVLNLQAAEERQEPVLPSLNSFLEGKDLYVSETALTAFNSIMTTIGGEKETKRAKELLEKLTVVKDCPSERALNLKSSARITTRSKIIFGTGDTLHAITSTANKSMVRAAYDQGVDFSVFFHSPRALTERKEPNTNVKQHNSFKD